MRIARPFAALLSVALVLIGAGCGGGGSAPPPTKTEVAKVVKTRIDSFVETALKNPKQAPADLEVLMEALDVYARDYGGGFTELRDLAKASIPEVQKAKTSIQLEGVLSKIQNKVNELAK